MTSPSEFQTQSGDNLRATGFMVGAMALFASEDFFVKRVTADMPVLQALIVLAIGGAVVFAVLCVRRNIPFVSAELRHPLVVGRNLSEAIATVAFVTALSLVPLSLASAILQLTPLLVTAGAAIWLGETVGWRRWTAVVVGLVGVFIILRPGFEGFRPSALLVLIAAVGLATRDVMSRRIPKRIHSLQLSLWAYAAVTIAAGICMIFVPTVESAPFPVWRDLGAAIALGAAAYMCLTTATRMGDVSAVIPFRYTRLLFALILGIVFLGERPDAATLVGAAIVVGSGLYALMRERKRRSER